jgi:hypothetical protein
MIRDQEQDLMYAITAKNQDILLKIVPSRENNLMEEREEVITEIEIEIETEIEKDQKEEKEKNLSIFHQV